MFVRGVDTAGGIALPEGPWCIAEPKKPTEWGPEPRLRCYASGRRVVVETSRSVEPMLKALGLRRAERDGKTVWLDTRKGAVLALWPVLSEKERRRWEGCADAAEGRTDLPFAPTCFAVRRRTKRIGPWALEQELGTGYAALAPMEARAALSAAGWQWHGETGLWWTPRLSTAASLAACAEQTVRGRLIRKGVISQLHDHLRFGPVLVPWNRKEWLLLCNRGTVRGFAAPGTAWIERRGGWASRSMRSARDAIRFAPRPLADHMLSEAHSHALSEVEPGSLQDMLGPIGGHGGGGAPAAVEQPGVWCGKCGEVVCTVGLAPDDRYEPCPEDECGARDAEGRRGHARRGLEDATLRRLRDQALLTREAWRKVAWKLAAPSVEANRNGTWTEADVARLVPEGLTLRAEQVRGIVHALERRVHVNGMEMGGGKTITTLVVANALLGGNGPKESRRMLVVCPAGLAANWMREAGKWLNPGIPRTHGAKASDKLGSWGLAVCSYQRIGRWAALDRWCAQAPLAAVACDESHKAKNMDAKGTKAVMALPKERFIALSGTWITNRAYDVQPVLATLDPEAFGNVARFRWAYRVEDIRSPTGAEEEMGRELGRQLRASVLFRPEGAGVVGDLPEPMPAEVLEVDIEGGAELGKEEWALEQQRRAGGPDRVGVLAQLAALRQKVGKAKQPKIEEVVQKLVAEEVPSILFACHREMAQALKAMVERAGARCTLVLGGQDMGRRMEESGRFARGEALCIAGTLDAMGEGHNLQRAGAVVITEMDWRSELLRQAVGRAQREGRTGRLRTLYVVAKDTLDGYMAQTVVGKSQTIGQALGDAARDPWMGAIAGQQAEGKSEREGEE